MECFDCQLNNLKGKFSLNDGLLSLESHDLLFPVSWAESTKRLYIIFSTRCNLRCVYCFQNEQRRTGSSIDKEDLYSLVRNFQNDINEIVLFGGEPLLLENMDVIEGLLSEFDYLKFICFTNGNFDRSFIDLLKNYSYAFERIVITLDGPKYVHDKRRINVKGSSYDIIVDNVKALDSSGVSVDIQINVDKNNESAIETLIADVSQDTILSKLHYCLNPVKYTEVCVNPYFRLKTCYPVSLSINNRLLNNLERLFSHEPLIKDRCGLKSTYVLDLPNEQVYACPQNCTSVIGRISGANVELNQKNISSEMKQVSFASERCEGCSYWVVCPYCCPFVPDVDNCRAKVSDLISMSLLHLECLIGDKSVLNGLEENQLVSKEGSAICS